MFDAVMLERGRLVAESVMRIERAEIAAQDYCPSDLTLQQWAHEAGSFLVNDQKGRVSHPRLRHVVQGEAPKPSYVLLHSPRQFSEELLKKTLRGVSAQKHTEPVIDSAQAFGVSPSSVFQKRVALTAQQLQAFPARFTSDCTLFPDTMHRGGEAFLCAGMAQVLAAIEAECAEPLSAPTKKAA